MTGRLRGLRLSTAQRTGFKDLLVVRRRFLIGLAHRLPHFGGTGLPFGLFSLPHGDYLGFRYKLQREAGRHVDQQGQTYFSRCGTGVLPVRSLGQDGQAIGPQTRAFAPKYCALAGLTTYKRILLIVSPYIGSLTNS